MRADVPGLGAPSLLVAGPLMRVPAADDTPASLRRQVEAQQAVVALGDLSCGLLVPKLLGQPVDLVVEYVGEALEKEERQQVSP